MGEIIAFIVWTIVALFFVGIAISARKSKVPVGFFTGVKPPEVTDVKAYNRAVSTLWFVVATLLELMGVPFLFLEQNSAHFIFIILLIMPLMIGMAVVYLRIEGRYKKK